MNKEINENLSSYNSLPLQKHTTMVTIEEERKTPKLIEYIISIYV